MLLVDRVLTDGTAGKRSVLSLSLSPALLPLAALAGLLILAESDRICQLFDNFVGEGDRP